MSEFHINKVRLSYPQSTSQTSVLERDRRPAPTLDADENAREHTSLT
jgi:hypothetical protein